MRKLFVVLILLIATNAFADFSGEYVKKNGVVDVTQKDKMIQFSINSSVEQHACNLEGTAVLIDKNRAAYTSNDNTDKCVTVLTFSKNGLKVTTKDCDSYCGLNAAGSMDGAYKKKASKKK